MRKISFGKALRRYPHPRHASTLPLNPPVRVTTLPNKIRVATENTPGHFSSVGLYVDTGARYETPSSSGVSHFLDRAISKFCNGMTGVSVNGARRVSVCPTLDFSYVMGRRRLQGIIAPSDCCVHEFVFMLPGCTVLMFAISMWESLVVGSLHGHTSVGPSYIV